MFVCLFAQQTCQMRKYCGKKIGSSTYENCNIMYVCIATFSYLSPTFRCIFQCDTGCNAKFAAICDQIVANCDIVAGFSLEM